MSPRIAIQGFSSRFQRGQAALLSSRIKALKRCIPQAEFSVFASRPEIGLDQRDVRMLESTVRLSSPRKMLGSLLLFLRCGLWAILRKYFRLDVGLLVKEERLQELRRSDVVISLGGDTLTVDYGILAYLAGILNYLFPVLLHKPFVIYAETIGPFKGRLPRWVARFFLNRVKLITLRDEESERELRGLGIRTPCYVTADSAFLLEPASHQKVKDILLREGIGESDRPLVGMSVSKLVSRFGFLDSRDWGTRYGRYIKLMAQGIDYLVDVMDATVLFVPHNIEPWAGGDDRVAADDIRRLIKNRARVRCISREYTAEEVKGIIGQCELFIGARMHALIASTSMCVPSMAISYSRKTDEIIGNMLEQKRYVLDIRELDYDRLTSKIEDVWAHREDVRRDLAAKTGLMKKRALWNAKLVAKLLDCSR